MADKDDATEPDLVRSWSPSRRQLLAIGGSALTTSFAGCGANNAPASSGNSTPASDTSGRDTQTQTERVRNKVARIQNVTTDKTSINVMMYDYSEVTFTLRVYSAPNLDRSNRTEIGSTEVTQTSDEATHEVEIDLPTGYAQQLQYTVEVTSPEAEQEVTAVKTNKTIVPFYNQAEGGDMVKMEPPHIPASDAWNAADSPIYETQVWFDAPDSTDFDTPPVPNEEYDDELYKHQNLTITALIRFPIYENMVEKSYDGFDGEQTEMVPRLEWIPVNFQMDAWEYLESFRWNSRATQEFEQGTANYGNPYENPDPAEYTLYQGGITAGSLLRALDFTLNASEANEPYNQYYINRHTSADVDVKSNPLLLATGRPICRRIADSMDNSFNNPSYKKVEYKDYHKALALQVFVGDNPYDIDLSTYSQTPEEMLTDWYQNANNDGDGAGTCQDSTYLYCGIAAHLINTTVVAVSCKYGNENDYIPHMMAGIPGLKKPETIETTWDNHPLGLATQPYTLETDIGDVSIAECTNPAPTIGWRLSKSFDYGVFTYLTEPAIRSHIPLNDAYEPSENGTVKAEMPETVENPFNKMEQDITIDLPEIPWEVHQRFNTVGDLESIKIS